jgi:hypothetical protein
MFKVLAASTLVAVSAIDFPVVESVKIRKNVGEDVCMPCLEFANDALQDLANFIGNNGIPTACGDLCSIIPNQFFAGACDSLCTAVGIDVFVAALQKVDLDPFYFCEEIDVCKVGPANAAAKPVKCYANPAKAATGATISLILDFMVYNATGVGEIQFELFVGSNVQQDNIPVEGFPVGAHGIELNLNTKGAPAGEYQFLMGICQGQCHSHHLTSKYFGNLTSSFTLTG